MCNIQNHSQICSMRTVIQRVSTASVTIDGDLRSAIGPGFMILLGIEADDTREDADWLAKKVTGLRVFSDHEGLMNRSLEDIDGDILVVSQFTLHASYKKGNRPSFLKSAKPDVAIPLYEYFVQQMEALTHKDVATGVFGADMKIALVNDGPVTILMDTKNKE